jgi:hypothetical protein
LESNLPSGRLANASSGSNPNVVALDAGTPESTGKPREQSVLPQRLFGQESSWWRCISPITSAD